VNKRFICIKVSVSLSTLTRVKFGRQRPSLRPRYERAWETVIIGQRVLWKKMKKVTSQFLHLLLLLILLLVQLVYSKNYASLMIIIAILCWWPCRWRTCVSGSSPVVPDTIPAPPVSPSSSWLDGLHPAPPPPLLQTPVTQDCLKFVALNRERHAHNTHGLCFIGPLRRKSKLGWTPKENFWVLFISLFYGQTPFLLMMMMMMINEWTLTWHES